ncbi:NYNRIN-like protein [Tanacetum coccineum]
MKLIPQKCSFGVEEGKFLDQVITKQGVRADPSKLKAVVESKPPRTPEEIHRFYEKVIALSAFLPKAAGKCLPLIKAGESSKNKRILQWTTNTEEAFRKLKGFIEEMPTLTTPIDGEKLSVYLAVLEESISLVLLAERGKRQVPACYLSRTLRGVEAGYSATEKLILALINAARGS